MEQHDLVEAGVLGSPQCYACIADNLVGSEITAGNFRDSNTDRRVWYTRFSGHCFHETDYLYRKFLRLGAEAGDLEENADHPVLQEGNRIMAGEQHPDWLDCAADDEIGGRSALLC